MFLESSIIKTTATKLGLACSDVFVALALASNPSAVKESRSLEVFSTAACSSSFTDEIWTIANLESNFRFAIAAINVKGKTARSYQGKDAIGLVAVAQKNMGRNFDLANNMPNTDFGVMQINFQSHFTEYPFKNNPALFLSPKAQLSYITGQLIPHLKSTCKAHWTACYHSPRNKRLQEKYTKKLEKSHKALKNLAKEKTDRVKAASAKRQNSFASNMPSFELFLPAQSRGNEPQKLAL
jgi:hypothetical protein